MKNHVHALRHLINETCPQCLPWTLGQTSQCKLVTQGLLYGIIHQTP